METIKEKRYFKNFKIIWTVILFFILLTVFFTRSLQGSSSGHLLKILFPISLLYIAYSVAVCGVLSYLFQDKILFQKISNNNSSIYKVRTLIKYSGCSFDQRGEAILILTAYVLGFKWIYAVTISWFGIILSYYATNTRYLYGLSAISIIVLLFSFPRKGAYLRKMERWKIYVNKSNISAKD